MKFILTCLAAMWLYAMLFGRSRHVPEHHSRCPRCKGNGHLPTASAEQRENVASTLPKDQRCPRCDGFGHVHYWFQ